MRQPWHVVRTRSGADLQEFSNPLSEPHPEKYDWGLGGLVLGLFTGVLVGSHYTFHTPVRRRLGGRP